MFCAKCGKELTAGEGYCPGCGTKVADGDASAQVKALKAPTALNMATAHKVSYFGTLLSLLLSAFFVGRTVLVISYTLLFKTENIELTMFEGMGFLKVLFILGYLGAIAAVVAPLLQNKEWSKWHFLPGICLSVVTVVLFLAALFTAYQKIDTVEMTYGVSVTCETTENVWILLVLMALNVILSLKTSRDIINTQDYWRVKLYEQKHKDQPAPKPPIREQEAVRFSEDRVPAWKRVQMENQDRDQ